MSSVEALTPRRISYFFISHPAQTVFEAWRFSPRTHSPLLLQLLLPILPFASYWPTIFGRDVSSRPLSWPRLQERWTNIGDYTTTIASNVTIRRDCMGVSMSVRREAQSLCPVENIS